MSETDTATENPDEPGLYAIRLQGHLEDRWAARFADLTLTREDNGDTLLTGRVADQAALHGLLRKVRDLALPLIAVTRVSPGQAGAAEVKQSLAVPGMVRQEKNDGDQRKNECSQADRNN